MAAITQEILCCMTSEARWWLMELSNVQTLFVECTGSIREDRSWLHVFSTESLFSHLHLWSMVDGVRYPSCIEKGAR